MNIGIFYFSATGVTKLFSNRMAEILKDEGHSVTLTNIIIPEIRESQIDFLQCDACIFGFPVFAGRLPTVAEDWISKLNGKNKKCSMFFTYGARDLEWAHQVTYYLLSKAQFQVVISAEFIGKHSFNVAEGWSLAENRPNQMDFDVAAEFTQESLLRFQSAPKFAIDLTNFTYKPVKVKKKKGRFANFYPSRYNKKCSMCNLCENECPTRAFDANSGETNRKLCIMCMHCVKICPDKVLRVGDVSQSFKDFIKFHGLTKEVVDKKQSKIIY